MKQYIRILICAAVFGIINALFIQHNIAINLSSFILYFGFGETSLILGYASNFMEMFFPYLFFHVFVGTYLYRHFCSASIYYFSRCCNRNKWYISEAVKMLMLSFSYVAVLLGFGILTTSINCRLTFDISAIGILIYYIVIFTLFLFSTTLCINNLSILFHRSTGFVVVESILVFFISTLFLTGEKVMNSDPSLPQYRWLIVGNPIAYLILSFHSSAINSIDSIINTNGMIFDINYSVLLFAIISIIVVATGFRAVNKHDFLYIDY